MRRALLILPVAVLALSACQSSVTVEPAENAVDPACADVMLRLPETVGGQERRQTTSQATAAWGDPSGAILRCGVTPPGPTTDPCVSVDGVDWVSQDEGEYWRFTAYGRDPGIEVLIDQTTISGQTVIAELGQAVSQIPADRACVGLEDATEVEGPVPADDDPQPITPTGR